MTKDDPLKRQMAEFEAARVSAPVHLEPTPVTAILAVLDGSDQDATVEALAEGMTSCTRAEVRMLRPGEQDALPTILGAAEGCQVVVVPSPFRRDYRREGQESLSTTIDLLLARSPAAVCLARAPVADVAHCLSHPLVVLAICRHRKVETAGMALAFACGGGDLALLSVVDPHQPVRDEELIGRNLDPADLSPDVLHALASARAAALTAELQRRAGGWRVQPHVHFAVGDAVETALEENARRRGLLVAGRDRDPRSQSAQQARRLVLGSEAPVLLV